MITITKKYLLSFPATNDKVKVVYWQLLTFFCLILPCFFPSNAASFDTSEDTWSLLGGYGQSFPGWGQTTQRVKTIDLTPRYTHVIFHDLGSDWYRGNHSIMLESPISYVISPESSAMIAINFLAAYNFTADPTYQPYIFGGGGPLYSFADIPGMGSELNGNYQFGLGLKYNGHTRYDLLFELRYHHISNGGSEEPNDPLNSLKFMIGVTF